MERAWTGGRSERLAGVRAGFSRAVAGLSLVSGLVNLLALTGSLYMLQVYDRVLSSRSIATLVSLSLIVVIAYCFQGLLEILRAQASARIAVIFEHRLGDVVDRLVLRRALAGMSRSTAQQPVRDMDTVRTFLASGGPVAFLDLPWMPVFLVFVFALHPAFGGLCLLGMALILALTWLTDRLSSGLVQQSAQADSSRRALIDASVQHAAPLHAMGIAERAASLLGRANHRFLTLQTRTSDTISVLSGISRVLRLTLQSAVLGLGAYLTIGGEVTAGAIVAATIATTRALAPLEQIIVHWRSFAAARESYRRLCETIGRSPPAAEPVRLPKPCASISLEGVAVAIPGTQRIVLQGIDFTLAKGEALAVVGPSAAGKSSLAKAIAGVWPSVRGSIRIDGAELQRWSSEDLGRHIGYVPQEVGLLEGTIAANIGRLEEVQDDDAILAAANAAGVHRMILSLPDGYETDVGPDGAFLSAGQRQRIALARALYRDPFLVILDEPNSNLDAEGEAALTSAIRDVRDRGGIAIVIAHRPSVLAAVDHVAMIANGKLAAFGPKDEVLKTILRHPLRTVAPVSS